MARAARMAGALRGIRPRARRDAVSGGAYGRAGGGSPGVRTSQVASGAFSAGMDRSVRGGGNSRLHASPDRLLVEAAGRANQFAVVGRMVDRPVARRPSVFGAAGAPCRCAAGRGPAGAPVAGLFPRHVVDVRRQCLGGAFHSGNPFRLGGLAFLADLAPGRSPVCAGAAVSAASHGGGHPARIRRIRFPGAVGAEPIWAVRASCRGTSPSRSPPGRGGPTRPCRP